MELFRAFATGFPDQEALGWMQKSAAAYFRMDGEVSADRCMQLPYNAKKFAKAKRDLHLVNALSSTDEGCLGTRCKVLSARLDEFLSRGEWPHWKRQASPPANADALKVDLFHIARCGERFNGKASLSPRQMRRIFDDMF
jgi:hypothetical protein